LANVLVLSKATQNRFNNAIALMRRAMKIVSSMEPRRLPNVHPKDD
jgi:hypothetical protein